MTGFRDLPPLDRRAFLRHLVGGAVAAGAALPVGLAAARAPTGPADLAARVDYGRRDWGAVEFLVRHANGAWERGCGITLAADRPGRVGVLAICRSHALVTRDDGDDA